MIIILYSILLTTSLQTCMWADVKMETDRAGGDSEIKLEEEATTSGKQRETNGPQEGATVKKEAEDMEAGEAGRRIFTLSFCNSYGSSDTMTELKDSGKPLKLNSELCVGFFWGGGGGGCCLLCVCCLFV